MATVDRVKYVSYELPGPFRNLVADPREVNRLDDQGLLHAFDDVVNSPLRKISTR